MGERVRGWKGVGAGGMVVSSCSQACTVPISSPPAISSHFQAKCRGGNLGYMVGARRWRWPPMGVDGGRWARSGGRLHRCMEPNNGLSALTWAGVLRALARGS